MSRDKPWVCPICKGSPCVCVEYVKSSARTASDLAWVTALVVPAFLRHGMALVKS